jgi:hypothetical protein
MESLLHGTQMIGYVLYRLLRPCREHTANGSYYFLARALRIHGEMNLKNLVPGDTLLDMIAMRATTPSLDAYVQDLNVMRQVVRARSFRLKNPRTGLYRFMDEESYGQLHSFAPLAPKNTKDRLLTLGRGYAIIKEEQGKLVLNRQSRIYPLLQIMMDDIMEHERE